MTTLAARGGWRRLGGLAGWGGLIGVVASDVGARLSTALSALAVPADLDPSGDEARRWVGEELAQGDYQDTRSLLERLMRWLTDMIADLRDNQGSGALSLPPFVIAIVVVVVLAGVGYLLTKVRVEQKTIADRRAVLGDSHLSAEQLRERAAASMTEGRWGEAVLDLTRAIAREADDRTLLTEAPSLTAHEIGSQLVVVFPAHVTAVVGAMDLFDAVAYGGRDATREDAESIRTTDDTLRRARPELPRTPRRPVGPPAAGTPAPGTSAPGTSAPEDEESFWTTGTRS